MPSMDGGNLRDYANKCRPRNITQPPKAQNSYLQTILISLMVF